MDRVRVRSVLERFRDEDGDWAVPEGRYSELVVLTVGLPLFAWHVATSTGLPHPAESWLAVLLGVIGGVMYLRRRDPILELLPEWARNQVFVSALTGGFVVSILEFLHVSTPTLLFVLTAGATVLVVYVLRLLSPLHDDLRPLPRGAQPPRTVD